MASTWGDRPRWLVLPLVLLVVLTAVVATWALRPRTVPAPMSGRPVLTPDPVPPVAAFIGDSSAAGVGASPRRNRWTTTVSAAQGWRELNLAEAGTGYLKSAPAEVCGEPRCPNYQTTLLDAVGAGASVVVVSGGQNDQRLAPARQERAVLATYEQIRRALPDALIVAVGPYQRRPGDRVQAMDRAVADAAEEVDAVYVDLLEPAVVKVSMVSDDGAGLNNAGHAAIARRVTGALR